MFRILAFAAALGMLAAGPAKAQSGFDATGQFTLSFKFGLPGAEKEKPKLGFRVGASNVPKARVDVQDPTKRGLSLQFDRQDFTGKTFAGVGVEFGEADKETIKLLDDPFSADSLGLSGQPVVEPQGGAFSADYLDSRTAKQDEAWLLGAGQQSTYGWMSSPVGDGMTQPAE